jgi:hypothetical protein
MFTAPGVIVVSGTTLDAVFGASPGFTLPPSNSRSPTDTLYV